jgi:hypothetical protein
MPRAQLRAQLLFGMHRETRSAPVERMPPRMISAFMDPRRFAGIDHNDALVVLDSPDVNRQPVAPFAVEQHVGEPRGSVAPRFHLCPLYLDKAGADGVDRQHETFNPRPLTRQPRD